MWVTLELTMYLCAVISPSTTRPPNVPKVEFKSVIVALGELKVVINPFEAVNIPDYLGKAVTYAGSTTGPTYNTKGSPFQVTWNVRPKVVKINISTINKWFGKNPFNETHAHGVRNLVKNKKLLSPINN